MSAAARRAPAVGALLALVALLLAAPRPAAAVAQLREASTATELTAPLVAALALLAWLLAGWLLLTASLTLLSRVPGSTGRAAATAVRRVAPAALRRLVATALGVSVVAGTLAATPASAAPGPVSPAAAVSPAAPDLDWASERPALDWPAPPGPAAPALDWPDDPPAAPVLGAPTSSGQAADAVVVQPGDSLWGLAEQRLAEHGEAPSDASVAAAWPAWWSANRDVIGDDPDLLLPGTTLQPPADAAAPDNAPDNAPDADPDADPG